jgi:hypothetical protein
MANPDRGEVVLRAGDKDYVLRFGFGALRALEAETDMSIDALSAALNRPEKPKTKLLAAMLRAALLHHHGHFADDALNALVDEAGILPAGAAVGRALALAFPEASAGNG